MSNDEEEIDEHTEIGEPSQIGQPLEIGEPSEIGEHFDPSEIDDSQLYTAEYKDGQLQIIEMTPFDRGTENSTQVVYGSDDGSELPDEGTKYVQLLDTGKGLQLDLLNFTLVKSEDGSNSYQMISTDSTTADNGDTTITCVLSSDDVDETENSFVMVHAEDENDPYMYLQSTSNPQETEEALPKTEIIPEKSNKIAAEQPKPSTPKYDTKVLTPVEILEKAKAFQKAKSLLSPSINKRGRKRKSDLPPPIELLSSPGFRLYLYNCKMCSFKCNAIKEMQAHRAAEHFGGKGGARGPSIGAGGTMQCARCPYRGHTHSQLVKHVKESHPQATEDKIQTAFSLNSQKVQEADVLVCGACGFESGDRPVFKNHIEVVHGATGMAFLE